MSIVLDGTTGLAGAATGALNGTLGATTPSTVVATTVVASSTIKGATTIAVGNATPSASGAGITFPATQSASTDANTLDDYEEGTWTPVLAGSSTAGTGTYNVQVGSYTKVGRLVIVTFALSWTAHTGTGNMLINNLPFASANINNYVEYVANMEFVSITMPASTIPFAVITNNQSTITIAVQTVATGAASTLAMDTLGQIYGSITYQTA